MGEELATYVSLEEAAQSYGMSVEALSRMAKEGAIRAVKTPQGKILVASNDIATKSREQFRHLQGRAVSMSEASRKYDIPVSTLHGWVERNLIKVLNPEERGQGRTTLLDESGVAYRAMRYHELKKIRGGEVAGMRIFATQ